MLWILFALGAALRGDCTDPFCTAARWRSAIRCARCFVSASPIS